MATETAVVFADWLIHHQAGPVVAVRESHLANVLDTGAVDAVQPDAIADDEVLRE